MNSIYLLRIVETIDGYKKLIEVLENNEDSDKVCRLSKVRISDIYGLSYTGTCRKLKFLLKYGQIEQVNGGFLRTGKEILDAKPFLLLQKIVDLVIEKPEVYSSFKQQADLLNEPIEEIQTAWGFFSYFFGTKYPDIQEIHNYKSELEIFSKKSDG